ncbi:MAG: hypothetical protein GF308_21230 [Candidatus Heimdallarchaeota archaeon]|nr:hypothetical protein [Candidatus Heimdallarchaeota archaeon]
MSFEPTEHGNLIAAANIRWSKKWLVIGAALVTISFAFGVTCNAAFIADPFDMGHVIDSPSELVYNFFYAGMELFMIFGILATTISISSLEPVLPSNLKRLLTAIVILLGSYVGLDLVNVGLSFYAPIYSITYLDPPDITLNRTNFIVNGVVFSARMTILSIAFLLLSLCFWLIRSLPGMKSYFLVSPLFFAISTLVLIILRFWDITKMDTNAPPLYHSLALPIIFVTTYSLGIMVMAELMLTAHRWNIERTEEALTKELRRNKS